MEGTCRLILYFYYTIGDMCYSVLIIGVLGGGYIIYDDIKIFWFGIYHIWEKGMLDQAAQMSSLA